MLGILEALSAPRYESVDQKYERIVVKYVYAVRKILLVEKPDPKDFNRLQKCVRERDDFFSQYPELRSRWEAVIKAAGPALFLPSSL